MRKSSRSRVPGRGGGRYLALALVVGADLGVAACGRSDVWYKDDAFGVHPGVGGSAGKQGVGGSGHATGGKGGTGTGGGTGVGGSMSTGGTFVTGGTGGTFATGGTGGTFVTGGTGGSFGGSAGGFPAGQGGMITGPFACEGTLPTCDAFTSFSFAGGPSWGFGDFTGGVAVFGPKIARVQDTSGVHVTGTVVNYGTGVILWFSHCSNLGAYGGVEFTLNGATKYGDYLEFMPLTNSDYPWQSAPENRRGACTSMTPDNPWLYCMEPQVNVPVAGIPLIVTWGEISGGSPVPWYSYYAPREIVGLQWLFPYSPAVGPYDFDITLDDVRFYGGGNVDCGSSLGGMGGVAGQGPGGMGGSSGAGFGGVGAAGGGQGGLGGSAGGVGGVAGSGAIAGEGGVVNQGGVGNEGGAPLAGGAGI